MSKKHHHIVLIISFCFLVLACNGQSTEVVCAPDGYVQTVNLNAVFASKVSTHWTYDEQGRVVIDSIHRFDSIAPAFYYYTTLHYHYSNDSIIGVGDDGKRVLIRLNPDGFPLYTRGPYKGTLYANYRMDGTLEKVTQGDTTAVFIDNIIYKHGNIISYREPRRVPGKNDSTHNVETFTYYKNRDWALVYRNQKAFALLQNRIFSTYIDVQAFSKSLLKSITLKEANGVVKKVSFRYKYDKKGRPIVMTRLAEELPMVPKHTSEFKFTYSCD